MSKKVRFPGAFIVPEYRRDLQLSVLKELIVEINVRERAYHGFDDREQPHVAESSMICRAWNMSVEMIVSQRKLLHDNLDVGYAFRVFVVFAFTVGWLAAVYTALLP